MQQKAGANRPRRVETLEDADPMSRSVQEKRCCKPGGPAAADGYVEASAQVEAIRETTPLLIDEKDPAITQRVFISASWS